MSMFFCPFMAGLLDLLKPDSHEKRKKGTVTIEKNHDEFQLVLTQGYFSRKRYSGRGSTPTEVPAGNYDMADIRFFRKNKEGEAWSTRSILPFDIIVKSGENTSLGSFPGPVRAKVDIREVTGEVIYLSFIMEDDYEHQYAYFRKDGNLLPWPGFRITDSRGEILKTGIFNPG